MITGEHMLAGGAIAPTAPQQSSTILRTLSDKLHGKIENMVSINLVVTARF